MASFAKIKWDTPARKTGIVEEVIVAEQDFINSGAVGDSFLWVQYSKSTLGGVHYNINTGQPDGGFPLRYNAAGIGSIFNAEKDAFYAPQPHPSWTLNQTTFVWEPPIAQPAPPPLTYWNEATLSWEEIEITQ